MLSTLSNFTQCNKHLSDRYKQHNGDGSREEARETKNANTEQTATQQRNAAGRAIGKRRGDAQTGRVCRVVTVPVPRFQWKSTSKDLTRRSANRAGVERRRPLDVKRPLRTLSPHRERRRRQKILRL
jgi:hypothetical protein